MTRKKRTTPAAFMSYVREDDRSGRLSEFRERLQDEIRMQLGEPFLIFQDRNDIQWGQNWKTRIDDAIDAVTFLVPIVTPSFFRSLACREELQRFVEREKALKRGDLIFPVYYVDTPLLNDEKASRADALAQLITGRQHADWRSWRFEPFSSPDVGKLIAHLAAQIRDALDRGDGLSVAAAASRSDSHSAAETEPTTEAKTVAAGGMSAPVKHNDPPTRVVDQLHRGDYTTITAAIQAANPGDRILVRSGYYQEALVIDKPLEMIGEGELSEVVVHSLGKHALLFQTTMGRVSNMTFRQAGGGNYFGVKIAQGRLELEDCDVSSEGSACIAVLNYADPRLRRNRIHNGTQSGVFVYQHGRGTFEDNEIFGHAFSGVEIKEGGNPTLRRNQIRNCRGNGVYVNESGLGTVEDNEISGNGKAGVKVAQGGKAAVRRNRINNNAYKGVWVSEGGGGTFEDNDVRQNHLGAWDIHGAADVLRLGNQE
jgi:parallel beta-helix repeat protein